MFPVLLPEQFHFSTQTWGGGPGAEWHAERISIRDSGAPQRKPGRRCGLAEAKEAGGDDKDRARWYVSLCECDLEWESRKALFLPSNPTLSKYSSTVCLRSLFPLHLTHLVRLTQVGLNDATVFPLCSEPLPIWQRLCGSTLRHKCGPLSCQEKLFDYKTQSADLMPGTLPLFYFATQNTFHSEHTWKVTSLK